jgi:hypothetical protein
MRFCWDAVAKHAILIRAAGWLVMWQTLIAYSPGAGAYRDQALAPVKDDDDEMLDLLTKTSGARAAVAHVKKIAALTGLPATRSGYREGREMAAVPASGIDQL